MSRFTCASLAFLACSALVSAQTATDPNEGLSLQVVPSTPGAYSVNWFGRGGRTYFLERSTDLTAPWEYFPIIETGANAPVGYGFTTDSPRVFVRLRYVDDVYANPYLVDSDGDGVINQIEFAYEIDPFDSDTDDDLIPDKWEIDHGSDPAKASVAFDTTADSDLDGLADAWEMEHFGSLAQGYFDDYDLDGVPNGEAQWSGEDPKRSYVAKDATVPSWLEAPIPVVSGETASGFTLTWPAALDDRAGRINYILYRNNQALGAASEELSRWISTEGLAGWQRWYVRPVDAAGNIGPASGILEREVLKLGETPFAAVSRHASGEFTSWGNARQDDTGRFRYFRTVSETKTWTHHHTTTFYDYDGVAYGNNHHSSVGGFTISRSTARDGGESVSAEGEYDSEWGSSYRSNLGQEGTDMVAHGEWAPDGRLSAVVKTFRVLNGERTLQSEEPLTTAPLIIEATTQVSASPEEIRYELPENTRTVGEPGPNASVSVTTQSATRVISYSDELTDSQMKEFARQDMPALDEQPWTAGVFCASREWSSGTLRLTEGEYRIHLENTETGRRYPMRWLEVFYPDEEAEDSIPQALVGHTATLVGNGGTVESDTYPLTAPDEPGLLCLKPVKLALGAPEAVAVNDDFDERLPDASEAWVSDLETPSPVKTDGALAIADLAPLSVDFLTLPEAEDGSLRLSVVEGAERIRLHALAPQGSGAAGTYLASDWWQIEDGDELLGTILNRRGADGASLPDWRLYAEGLAPGKVVLRLEGDFLGLTLSAEKTLYVTRTELVQRDSETGDTHAVGGLLDGVSLRPSVELRVDSAVIGPDGDELRIQVSGTVFDPLSESLAEALARTRALVFEVNGRTVSGIANLPDLPAMGSLHRPWQSARFEIEFTRSFRIPTRGPATVILRAVTTANPAGERGWDEAAILLARIPEGDQPVATAQVPLSVAAIHHGEGPEGGGAGPAVLRVDGLAEAPADLALGLTENGAEQLLAPLTFSPRYFYVVGPERPGQPMRYLVTLDDSVELPPGQSLRAVRSGKNSFVLRVGDRIVSEAEVQAVPMVANWSANPAVPKPARDLAEIEGFYTFLYKRPASAGDSIQLGLILRDAFKHCGGLVQLGEGDEVDRDTDFSGRLVITIGRELDPLSAATGLFEQLVSFSLHPTMQEQVIEDGYGGDLFASGRLTAVRTQSHELGAVVLELYKAAISIVSEPADCVIAMDEISQGNWSAAIGFLPFVPASARYVIKKKGTGEVLAEFSDYTVAVLESAMRTMKLDKIRGRLNVVHGLRDLRNAGFADQKLIDVMVDSGHLTITKSRGYKQLKEVLGPPPSFFGYQAHHWIPLERPIQDKALRQCIDPNEHGIWLKKAIHQKVHNVPVPGFIYRGKEFSPNKYNDIWKEFFSRNYFENATDQEILDFVHFLQRSVYKL